MKTDIYDTILTTYPNRRKTQSKGEMNVILEYYTISFDTQCTVTIYSEIS